MEWQPRFRLAVGLGLLLCAAPLCSSAPAQAAKARLERLVYTPLPLGQIRPSGWLNDQLLTQARGLSGHLDEFWPDIQKSAWFGGDAEGWERVPYWLDGMVPLAYLLDDAALKAKVQKAIDYILEHQQADGWLGPVGDKQNHKAYDVWPLFPLFKALTQYQEATGDPRVIPALLRCARKIDAVISQEPVYSWAKVRVADLAVSLYWLDEKTQGSEPWLLDLARKAFGQSHDWLEQYQDTTYSIRDRVATNHNLESHGVNTGMALKYGPMRWRISGKPSDRQGLDQMLRLLDQYHGQPTGIFTCDEHLGGLNPSQGTELCTVVEAMYALEQAIATSASAAHGDRLERLAYNALPATFKKDMTAHQYDQQVNQVICTREGDHVYTSNGPDSNLYGLEPNFGCCTANMHQGWPKFVESLWMKTADGGLAAVAYAPCVVKTEIAGKPITLEVKTAYPFRDQIDLVVTVPQPMKFPIYLRQPGWSAETQFSAAGAGIQVSGDGLQMQSQGGSISVSGAEGQFLQLQTDWAGTQVVKLTLRPRVEVVQGYHNAVSILRGPLVYALDIPGEWKTVIDRKDLPFDDWEVFPTAPWNYALQFDPAHPAEHLKFEELPLQGETSPFVRPYAPLVVKGKGRRLPDWKIEKAAAQAPPQSPVTSAEPLEDLTLVPYGTTDLRVTSFPWMRP